MPRRKKTEDETPRTGHNGPSPVAFVERIERCKGELATLRGKYMVACKGVREDINGILVEAEDEGLSRKALKSVLKARDLEAKADAVREALEDEDQTAYDNIRVALGDFADTPLGQAAIAQSAA